MKNQTEEGVRIADYGDYLQEIVNTLKKQEKTYLDSYEKAIIRTHKAETMLEKFNKLQKSI